MTTRDGTVLILIAGLSAMLAAMSAAFLITMRSDAEETNALESEAQARLMLNAGLMYVAETARLGWQPAGASEPIEAYGWVDVRSGKPGPRDQFGRMLFAGDDKTGVGSVYPAVGTSTRCPFHVLMRPPCATSLQMVPNPMPLDPGKSWAELVSLKNPSPIPLGADWNDFMRGDPTVRANSAALSWFRVFRKSPAVFVITCGAGASQGFRSFAEASAAGEAALFNDDPAEFDDIRRRESLLWYETEWNPATYSPAGYLTHFEGETIRPAEVNKPFISGTTFMSPRNFVGSFLYLQRLRDEPSEW